MKTYEPPDGNMSTVGAKCFRCAEVLLQSEAIRGLFAAGEVVGDAHGNNRLSGIFLLDCVVVGRVAGAAFAQ